MKGTPLQPQSEEDLAALIREAQGPLAIRGGGTRGRRRTGEGRVLSLAGLSGISLYEPAALTLVAAAGTPLQEVTARLAAEGQRLAFEVPDLRTLLNREGETTLGGIVAENASGPRRIQAGACRDALLGLRFVDGRGTVLRNGGRVMKNVTGYDLARLLAGSRGTLAVLSEVALKVAPVPPAAATVVVPAADAAQAVTLMTAALATPWDLTGAAWLPERGVLLRIEGLERSVAYRAEQLTARLGAGQIAEGGAGLWERVRDVRPLAARPGALWRVCLRPGDTPVLIARLSEAAGLRPEQCLLDWGGGLIWLRLPEDQPLRPHMKGLAGHATRLAGAGEEPAEPPEPAAIARISAEIRARFDPRGLFAPAEPCLQT